MNTSERGYTPEKTTCNIAVEVLLDDFPVEIGDF